MSKYSNAKNFFEINMIEDFDSKKMMTITDNEINFLQRMISNPDAEILDVMCGYGRLGNRLYDLGYQKISGVDMGTFDFIPEKRKFNFYNADFYNWIPSRFYDYCYSLYNSYDSYESFLKTIDRCKLMLKEKGILIIDIFNKDWRDRLPDTSYRIVNDEQKRKVVQKEISTSSLRAYFENPEYIYKKRVEMVTIISEGVISGLNIYIKRIPNIENRVMDVFGKGEIIRNLINSIVECNNRSLLNIINDKELSEQNFSQYNLRFADLNGVIEEEMNMYTLTKESEINGVRSKILLRNRGIN